MNLAKVIFLTNFFFSSVALSGLYFWWLITAFFLIDFFRHLFRGILTTGRIVGYGKKSTNNSVYFPVVEFTDQTGQTHEVYSDTGSSSFDIDAIGKNVSVNYLEGKGQPVHIQGSASNYALPMILIAVSIGIFFIFNLSFHFRPAHYAFAAFLFFYSLFRMRFIGDTLRALKNPSLKLKSESNFEPDARLISMEELRAAQSEQKQTTQASWLQMPYKLFAIIGMMVLFFSFYTSQKQWYLQKVGVRTDGAIVSYKSSDSSDGKTVYYPIVIFKLPHHAPVRFQDRVGSSYTHQKRDVRVLFDPNHVNNAIIDRGIFNWMAPLMLLLFAVIMLLISLKSWTVHKSVIPLKEFNA